MFLSVPEITASDYNCNTKDYHHTMYNDKGFLFYSILNPRKKTISPLESFCVEVVAHSHMYAVENISFNSVWHIDSYFYF